MPYFLIADAPRPACLSTSSCTGLHDAALASPKSGHKTVPTASKEKAFTRAKWQFKPIRSMPWAHARLNDAAPVGSVRVCVNEQRRCGGRARHDTIAGEAALTASRQRISVLPVDSRTSDWLEPDLSATQDFRKRSSGYLPFRWHISPQEGRATSSGLQLHTFSENHY